MLTYPEWARSGSVIQEIGMSLCSSIDKLYFKCCRECPTHWGLIVNLFFARVFQPRRVRVVWRPRTTYVHNVKQLDNHWAIAFCFYVYVAPLFNNAVSEDNAWCTSSFVRSNPFPPFIYGPGVRAVLYASWKLCFSCATLKTLGECARGGWGWLAIVLKLLWTLDALVCGTYPGNFPSWMHTYWFQIFIPPQELELCRLHSPLLLLRCLLIRYAPICMVW